MKNTLLLITLVTTQVLGDIWLSEGMKQFGPIASYAPSELLKLLIYLLTSPWIWLGVSTLVFSMIIYLVAISDLDISYVLPIHGSSYVLNALMAWLILDEQVSFMRWLATLIITLGVLIMGWNEISAKPSFSSKNSPNSSRLVALPLVGVLPKLWLGTVTLAIADSMGDLLTAKGMKIIGSFPAFEIPKLIDWGKKVITSPFIIAGISCQALSFFIFLSLLSWADISLVRPATAIGYMISLLGAKFVLKEKISQGRFVGISVIGLGIGVISLSH